MDPKFKAIMTIGNDLFWDRLWVKTSGKKYRKWSCGTSQGLCTCSATKATTLMSPVLVVYPIHIVLLPSSYKMQCCLIENGHIVDGLLPLIMSKNKIKGSSAVEKCFIHWFIGTNAV